MVSGWVFGVVFCFGADKPLQPAQGLAHQTAGFVEGDELVVNIEEGDLHRESVLLEGDEEGKLLQAIGFAGETLHVVACNGMLEPFLGCHSHNGTSSLLLRSGLSVGIVLSDEVHHPVGEYHERASIGKQFANGFAQIEPFGLVGSVNCFIEI